MISNSGHDENGKYSGGKAGDQTGQEQAIIEWYNRPQNVVLRYPDINVGLKIAELAKKAANNNKIGYDQNERTTYWTQLSNNGYDPSKITKACESDCTAGVTANVKAVGYLMGISKLTSLSKDIYSGNMKKAFKNAGFQTLTDSKYLTSDKYLLPGDVLLYEGHHAATNLSYGAYASKETVTNNGQVKTANGKWQYYENGTLITNRWIKSNGKWYRVDGLGYMQTGQVKEVKNGKTVWYYLDPSTGAMYENSWLRLDEKWYYFGSDGIAYSQKQLKDNNKWYFFATDCHMKESAWIEQKNKYYYVGKDGIMATDAYIKDTNSNKYYYVDKNGVQDGNDINILPVGAKVVI